MKTALVTGACINTGVAIVEKFLKEDAPKVELSSPIDKVTQSDVQTSDKRPRAFIGVFV